MKMRIARHFVWEKPRYSLCEFVAVDTLMNPRGFY